MINTVVSWSKDLNPHHIASESWLYNQVTVFMLLITTPKFTPYSHFDKIKVRINLFSFPDSQSQWKNLWTLHLVRNTYYSFLSPFFPASSLSLLLISSLISYFFLPFFFLSLEKTSTVWHKYGALLTFSSQCQRKRNFSAEIWFLAH